MVPTPRKDIATAEWYKRWSKSWTKPLTARERRTNESRTMNQKRDQEAAIEDSWEAFFGSKEKQETLSKEIATARDKLINETYDETAEGTWYGSAEEQKNLRREICDEKVQTNKGMA